MYTVFYSDAGQTFFNVWGGGYPDLPTATTAAQVETPLMPKRKAAHSRSGMTA